MLISLFPSGMRMMKGTTFSFFDCLCFVTQAMERRYTALAEQQGALAAEKEKLSSEKQALMEVIAAHLQACAFEKVPSNLD